MKSKSFIIIIIVIFVIFLSFLVTNKTENNNTSSVASPSQTTSQNKNNCISDDCLINGVEYPTNELPKKIEESLLKGLDDEYKAFATYQAIMSTFGNIRPFVMIARAEQQHINSLQALFEKYGTDIPDNPYQGTIEVPGNIQSSCALGVNAEIENIRLYKETLLPLVANYPDITLVYTNLMKASEQKHLPAFQRCD